MIVVVLKTREKNQSETYSTKEQFQEDIESDRTEALLQSLDYVFKINLQPRKQV